MLRVWTRRDLDRFAQWPKYPPPHEGFSLGVRGMGAEELDRLYAAREAAPSRVMLSVDLGPTPCAGYLSLVDVDWEHRTAGNMAVRLAPTHCDQGVGTRMMGLVAQWALGNGMKALRLDVAASNVRAVRCYEKAGFVRTGQFWRDAPGLLELNLNEPPWDHVRPHARFDGPVPQLRFLWMERRA